MMYKTDQNCIPCFVVSIINVGVKKIFHHIFVWIFSRYVSWTPCPDSPRTTKDQHCIKLHGLTY